MPDDRTVVNAKSKPEGSTPETVLVYGIDEMHYYITTSLEKFGLAKATERFGQKGKPNCYAVLFPADPLADYHVHFHAVADKNEVNLHVSYFQNDMNEHDHAADEISKEVAAENFMQWLGQFFKYSTCQAHMHLHYIFPASSRVSTLFPLPMKTADVEIDGLAVSLPKCPGEVSKVRFSLTETAWFVEAIANKKLTVAKFSLLSDARTVLSVIDTVLEPRKT